MKENNKLVIPVEIIMSKIYLIRGIKVMLDMDLAELYGVETKVLKQAVRRNIERFPGDFMFELTREELNSLRSQIVTSNRGGTRYLPLAFTEQGLAMLSSVLNSRQAILLNIEIIRIFTRLREMLLTNKDILQKLREFEISLSEHDDKIRLIFDSGTVIILEQIIEFVAKYTLTIITCIPTYIFLNFLPPRHYFRR